ncbi:hypothetical protein EDD28_2057 [Salana multivorans]|uniref:Ribbon-helix-helix CopG family protein n=2 Tax=Salana multivorans TaxID=120377 RepID=A0A3N2DCR7_9MICO|nr:antitoxin [Salana multivorans]OJX97853.1 MAG: hypothetical protein BGO96_13095 [Micrococcales bacterium 73-15]ROR97458.1 hypothetical protein EDD28_2057 [Salana multivorans]
MTDVVVRNVTSSALQQIEADAARLGLSRDEYLRIAMERLSTTPLRPVTAEDLQRFGHLTADLRNDAVRRAAWGAPAPG